MGNWEDPLFVDNLDYWRLCDELNVFQAALLTIGLNPSAQDIAYCENWPPHERPHGYEAAKTAIANALRKGTIAGQLKRAIMFDANGNPGEEIADSVDIYASRVDVDTLRAWLAVRGFKRGFFFPMATSIPDYLDPCNPRFAPKLAAALQAWQAVSELGKKSPKQALEKWLRENALQFGFTDDEGYPLTDVIEECSKIANWQPAGNASMTRNAVPVNQY